MNLKYFHNNPDIPLGSPFVSKEHAIIENTSDGFTLIDKCSKNGTRINGIPLEKGKTYTLHHGNQISLANDNVICYFCWRNDSLETLELIQ
jgi:two-component system response regulator QseB